DLRSLTISAFAHFVFGYSDRQMVFADLLGTPSRVRGCDGLVLFDLMTHTLPGSCGVGDFGKEGINTFIQDHKCNAVCFGLQLDTIYPLKIQAQRRSGRRKKNKDTSSEEEEDELDQDQ
ncbi:kinase-like domain-containing protein, partial [Mycena rebaudengoi]